MSKKKEQTNNQHNKNRKLYLESLFELATFIPANGECIEKSSKRKEDSKDHHQIIKNE